MTTHNKVAKLLTVATLICILCLLFVPTGAFADEMSDPPIILLDKGKTDGNRVEIVATLARNSGILSMLLTLSYDDTALTLIEVTDGDALGTLTKQHSGSVSTVPYKIHYMWQDYANDYSTGVLLKFVFEVKSGAKNGAYSINLTADDNGVEYWDNDVRKTKKLMSDSVTITVDGTDTKVEVIHGSDNPQPTDNNTTQTVILAITVGLVVVGLLVLFVVLMLKKDRSKDK